MNKTGNKQLVFEPFIKREKNGSKSIIAPAIPTILVYKDSFNAWHCDIDINGYKYGALRFSSQILIKMVETRQVTQVMVWKLILNPMRANTEASNLVAWSDDKDKLLNWYKSQLVEPYSDNGSPSFKCHGDNHSWHKVFAKESQLEWYNPMDNEEGYPNHYGHGLQNEWVDLDVLPNINVGYRVW